jgi:CDP-paratose 2-epimerase
MSRTVLITGGCGFIGCNLAERLLCRQICVRVLDDLSRPGSEINRRWLERLGYGDALAFIQRDIRDACAVREATEGVQAVFHLAAQVAVTSSVANPRHDLEVNVLGTLNVLEAARQSTPPPLVVYTSTNKVYGEALGVPITELPTRHAYVDLPHGISEGQPLDFHSPYGCSKGSADQYVHDYARIYGLPTVVLRQSCIYGPHQFGNEDQGWVAHFAIAALEQRPLVIYGDGKQVRDVLYITDLLDLCELLLYNQDRVAGQIFNVGGGRDNTISIWQEFGPLLQRLTGRTLSVRHDDWRPGDQKVYISDIRKVRSALGWHPRVGVEDGVRRLLAWLGEQVKEG